MSRMNGNQYHGLLNNHQFAQPQQQMYQQQMYQQQMQQPGYPPQPQQMQNMNVLSAMQQMATRQRDFENGLSNVMKRLQYLEQQSLASGGSGYRQQVQQPTQHTNPSYGTTSQSYQNEDNDDEFRHVAGSFSFNKDVEDNVKEDNIPTFDENKANKEIVMNEFYNLKEVNGSVFGEHNQVNVAQLKLMAKNLKVKSGEDIITEGLSSVDFTVFGEDGNEQTAAVFNTTNVNKSYSVAINLIKKELLVPAESLSAVMKRLFSSIKEAEVLVYLHALDRVLTRKLNDFYSINVGDLGIGSYVHEVDNLNTILRTNHPEIAEHLIVNFNKIVNFTVRESYENYIESLPEDCKEIDLVSDSLVLYIDRYSLMMGIDTNELFYDKFVKFEDLSTEVNALAFIVNNLIEERSQEQSIILISKEGDLFKFMRSLDGNLHVKRFASFM